MRYQGKTRAAVDAVQWDGTSAGADSVTQWLRQRGYESELATYPDQNTTSIKVRIGPGSYLLIGRDDWLALYEDGGVTVMTDPWFRTEYEVEG